MIYHLIRQTQCHSRVAQHAKILSFENVDSDVESRFGNTLNCFQNADLARPDRQGRQASYLLIISSNFRFQLSNIYAIDSTPKIL